MSPVRDVEPLAIPPGEEYAMAQVAEGAAAHGPTNPWVALAYLAAGIFFILALRGLSSPSTSRAGNRNGMIGMLIAVVTVIVTHDIANIVEILIAIAIGGLIGFTIARKIAMTAMPELVAGFHSLVGMAAVLVGLAAWMNPGAFGILDPAGQIMTVSRIELGLGIAIGAITFSGSVIAFLKLSGRMGGSPILLPARHLINLGTLAAIIALIAIYAMAEVAGPGEGWQIIAIAALAFAIGFLLIIPIGGADMPVVIALLNSYSGLAAAATGFVLSNNILIICGALVGASGMILTRIMCKAMNRSISNIIFGAVGTISRDVKKEDNRKVIKYTEEDASMILESAQTVILIPGYGLAVAQAQFALQELVKTLINKGINVRYAIHPVAGRMPGHMNVLLAEANVPYDQLVEMDDINPMIETVDVAVVIGANDVVNPAARHDESSPIYGMPIINVDKAKTVFVLKRSMNPGFAGVQNELFFYDNARMLFGDAKQSIQGLVGEFKNT